MKNLIFRTITVTALLVASFSLLVTAPVYASAKDDVCNGLATTGSGCDKGSVNEANSSVNNAIRTVINILSLVVGVVAVIMIMIGGLKYVMSSGDSANITSAKNTILYAIIGLVVVAFAQAIVRFVLGRVN